jgi:hypothetical protein
MTIHKIVSVSYIKAGARISTDLEFVTTCSPAMLLTPDDAFAEFRLDDGWIVFDPDITGLEVPIRVTRECIAKHRDGSTGVRTAGLASGRARRSSTPWPN